MTAFRLNTSETRRLVGRILNCTNQFVRGQLPHDEKLFAILETSDVDRALSFAIASDPNAPKVVVKKPRKENLFHPIGLYFETYKYWLRVHRKASYLEKKFGSCTELLAAVEAVLRVTQADLAHVHSRKTLCSQRNRSYLQKIYYPREIIFFE